MTGLARCRGQVWRAFGALLASSFVLACTVGPNYERPQLAVPNNYRGADQAKAESKAGSAGDLRWSEQFTDPVLKELITKALAQNYDVRIAASRVLQAEAQLSRIRAEVLPSANADASASVTRSRFGNDEPARTLPLLHVGATLSWELDFWGRYRRASEGARAQILASAWGERAIVTSLVSRLATGYFQLRAFDRQLEIAARTLTSREESLHLSEVRERGGAGSLIDVRQAEQLVQGARAEMVLLTRTIHQQENLLSYLVGADPGAIRRGQALEQQPHPPTLPAGLPSTLLERRPDIQQAEQLLIAANAGIGFAVSGYFPHLNLTASGGVASDSLTDLFSASAGVFSLAASLIQPLFDSGRTAAEVELAKLRTDEAVLVYQQVIKQAFREASDAIVGYQRDREFREIQELVVTAARDARRLAELRYQGGTASYFEVLDSETRLFTAELNLVQAEFNELASFVEIYRALGGGYRA